MLRHVASAALLAGLLLVPATADARAGGSPTPQSCDVSAGAYVGLAATLDANLVTCGTADLQRLSPFGPDDFIVAGAHRLGALSWDLDGQQLWACDGNRLVGTIAWTGSSYAFTPRFTSNCKSGLAYDGVDRSVWIARGRTLTERSAAGVVLRTVSLAQRHVSVTALAVGRDDLFVATANPVQVVAVPRGGGAPAVLATPASRVRDLECNGNLVGTSGGSASFGVATGGRDCTIGGAGDLVPATTSLTVTPSEGAAPLQITATVGGTDPDGSIASGGFMWYDGSHDDGTYATTAQHVFYGAGVYSIAAWVIDDVGLPSRRFLQRTVVVHGAAACDPGAPLSAQVDPQGEVYDVRLNNPGCTDVKVSSLTVHLSPGFSVQPGQTQQQLHFIADPVASDGGRTLTWPGIDILLPQDNAPVALRLWWQERPTTPGTYPSQVVLETGTGQVVVDAPIVVS
jgi:hypothetical protein